MVSIALAHDGKAQEVLNRAVTIQCKDLSIKTVLTNVEKAAGVSFMYSPELIRSDRKVSIEAREQRLETVLLTLLQPLKITYEVVGNRILLKRSSTSEETGMNGSAQPADQTITGKVTDEKGEGLPGVSVVIKGSTRGTTTDAQGTYRIAVPDGNTILTFSFVGYTAQDVTVGNRTEINVRLESSDNQLNEVVVTGYTTQQKKDIIGAVAVVKASDLAVTPSANLMSQLQGRASGVTISTTGDPGGSANVRIRGFSSYGNNNPLYIIDGVPTTDASRLNPQDVESLQVLKDASSAAIYGARAANGVIIVTTKQGKAGRTVVSYDTYVGTQRMPFNRVPSMLNTAETIQYLDRSTAATYVDPLFGQHGSFSIPDYFVVSNSFRGGVSASDPRANPDLYTIADYNNIYQILKTSPGTDWFRAISQNAPIQSHQLTASGGTDKSTFSLGLNYFNQAGIFQYTGYNRYSVRVNSSFKPTKFFRFGENVQVAYDNRAGEPTVLGENSPWSYAYRSAPYIPVNDIKGGWGGTLIGSTSGVGWNPLAQLYRRKDWTNKSVRVFGNLFADIIPTEYLTFRTSIGVDAGNGILKQGLLKEYERNERRTITTLTEGSNAFTSWTWTNTLTFQKTIATDHDTKILLGTEAIKNDARSISASVNNFDYETNDFMTLSSGVPKSLGDVSVSNPVIATTSLFSYFGRLDYTYKGKYLLNATIRRDGSSLFGPEVRYATFPSVGLGWRLSDEPFLKQHSWIDELKLRGGWGIMGSISNVPAFNQYSTFSSTAAANFYDISGVNVGSTQGYGVNSQGNLRTKWESTTTTNLGIDASFLRGSWNMSLDVYNKDTDGLLVPSLRNGLEAIITKPLVNLGSMNNRGIDLQVGNRGTLGNGLKYDLNLTFTHYRNRLTKLNDENTAQYVAANRLPNALITTTGQAISSFYGYQIDGFYNNQSEVDNGVKIGGAPGQIGTWKYKDLDGNGNITPADRTVLGSPHPAFQMGFNVGLNWKGFDFTTFLFWNYGNQLFNYTKYYTYMNIIGGGIARGKLYDAWTPETAATAKTPTLGAGTANGYTSFVTGNSTSFYVENGSFLRAKTIQIGYTIPASLVKKISLSNLRIYAQAQNLFTVTKYTGADPDLGLVSGNQTDQNLGVDYSGFPNPRQFLLGLNLSF